MAADSDGESSVGFPPHTGCLSAFVKKGETLSRRTSSEFSWGFVEKETLTDNDLIQTVFTCQGDLEDPDFPKKFTLLLDKLSMLLCTGKEVLMKVNKVEPWNSVRVTLTIPRDAAQRLRALAQAGDAALQALGILSVQVEGDRVISLRLAPRFGGEPQEIVLRTGGENSNNFTNSGSSVSLDNPLGHIVTGAVPGTTGSQGIFRSPNVVAPSGIGIPPSPKPLAGAPPFPFTSMNHAAQAQQGRDSNNQHNFTAPPPYPCKTYGSPGLKTTPSQSTQSVSPATAAKKPVALSSNVPIAAAPAAGAPAAAATSATKLSTGSTPTSYSARDVNSKLFAHKLPPPGVQTANVNQLKNVVSSDSAINSNNMSLSSPLLVNLLQNDGSPVTGTATSSSANVSATNKMAPPNPDQLKTIRKNSPEQSEQSKLDLDSKNFRSSFANNFNSKMTPKSLANSQARMPPVRQRSPTVKTGFQGNLPGYGCQSPGGMPSIGNLNVIRPSGGRYGSNLMKAFPPNPLQAVANSAPGRPNTTPVQRFSQIRAGFPNAELRSNVLVQGFSQYTASSSKPCSSAETADKNSEEAGGICDGKKLIINPLTGELEPMPSESSESEEEALKEDPFLFSSSPACRTFSDDDSTMSRRNDTSDQSDSEATNKSTASETSNSNRRRGGASHKVNRDYGPEKIKLRLKLEKSEPITQAYKVDVSFVNCPTPRKPLPVSGNRVINASGLSGSNSANNGGSNSGSTALTNANSSSGGSSSSSNVSGSPAITNVNSTEEPRVPPLHISLRGPNAAVVVSNRKDKKSPSHWGQVEDEDRFPLDGNESGSDFYSKLNKKKVKVSNLKLGREIVAINSSEMNSKSKKLKLKRMADRGEVDSSVLKLKIPVTPTTANDHSDGLDSSDEKSLVKKRKESKKQKNNLIGVNKKHLMDLPESEVAKRFEDMVSTVGKRVELNLKMDSEEWISRTLKEETLNYEKRKNCNKFIEECELNVKKEEEESGLSESDNNLKSFEIRRSSIENDGIAAGNICEEDGRTKSFKPGSLELSDLLRRKKVGGGGGSGGGVEINKKSMKSLDCLKVKGDFVKHKYMELTELAAEGKEEKSEEVSVKKPQEIGGKIKSELTSKIDRVSGKLKNDLSVKLPKDGLNKKLKFDESGLKKLKLDEIGKALKKNDKTPMKTKGGKKDSAGSRLGNSDGEEDHEGGFSRAKRRHSGDQSVSETQTAQKVKSRSSSSEQLGTQGSTKTTGSSRRFDALSRKIRKDSVIDRLRKEKMNKVFALNRKLSTGSDPHSKKQTVNRMAAAAKNPSVPTKASIEIIKEGVTNLCESKPPVTSLEGDTGKGKNRDGVESPNNPANAGGESPANQGNTQGEDSGIESMDALSEKSPNQGESPCRKEESHSKELEISKPEEKKGQNHDRTADEEDPATAEETKKKSDDEHSCLNKSKSVQNKTQADAVPSPDGNESRSDSKTEIDSDSLNRVDPISPRSTNINNINNNNNNNNNNNKNKLDEDGGKKISGSNNSPQIIVSSQSEEIRVSNSHNRAGISQRNDCDSEILERDKSRLVVDLGGSGTTRTGTETEIKDEKSSAIEEAEVTTNLLMETFETKIREAFLRNELKEFDTTAEGLGAKILEDTSKGGNPVNGGGGESNENKNAETEMGSPLIEEIERFRVNPPLYTYAKREDSLSPSPPAMDGSDLTNNLLKGDQQAEEDFNGSSKKRITKKFKSSEEREENASSPSPEIKNKSLLEQLLIEIPGEDSRKTRSWHRLGGSPGGTPKSSPRSLKDERPVSPPSAAKTSPKNASKLSPTPRNKRKLDLVDEKIKQEVAGAAAAAAAAQPETRPNKRKCSENAAELIKACMGVDDKKQLLKTVQSAVGNKKGSAEIESSDDEPLIDLAGKGRSREHSVEQEIKKPKLGSEEENRNNNKVSTKNTQGNATCKTGAEPPTRRSIRQHVNKSDSRSVRYTRSAITQESTDLSKRRRTSRDGK